MLAAKGIALDGLNPLDKLSIIGSTGMGVLEYKPANSIEAKKYTSLEKIAEDSLKIFESKPTDNLDEVFAAGGSSGGARPKVFTKIENED